MKVPTAIAVVVAFTLTAPVLAAEEPAAPTIPPMNMGMNMDKQMAQMQENMKIMQQQVEKLRTTTDPKERQKLLQEHMQTMQKNMAAMRGMGGPMMGGMGGRSGMGGPMMNMDPKQREAFMQGRMDMMQMMMEHMMQHQSATQGADK